MMNFQINNITSYPRIITPNFLKSASNSVIRFEEVYPSVKKPSFPERIKVDENKEFKILGGGVIFGVILYFVFGLLCLIITELFLDVSKETWRTYWFPTILIISIVGGVIAIILGFIGNDYQSKITESKHKEKIDKYKIELEKYNKLLSEVTSDKFQKIERLKRLKIILKENNKYIFRNLEILDDGAVKKGISEEFFYKFLVRYSDIKVYKSIKHSFYFPDLILLKCDIFIVLEIDEPYTLEAKEPIHFKDSDKARDEHFIKNNFVLIRFTEEQIISFPEKCLDVINETIECCIKLNLFKKSSSFLEIECPIWTYQEAFDFAYKNSRNNVPDRIQNLEQIFFS